MCFPCFYFQNPCTLLSAEDSAFGHGARIKTFKAISKIVQKREAGRSGTILIRHHPNPSPWGQLGSSKLGTMSMLTEGDK